MDGGMLLWGEEEAEQGGARCQSVPKQTWPGKYQVTPHRICVETCVERGGRRQHCKKLNLCSFVCLTTQVVQLL